MCNCGKKREALKMSTTVILDKVLPYTREELRCGIKKREKQRLRHELAVKIQKYNSGVQVNLPDEIKILLDEQKLKVA